MFILSSAPPSKALTSWLRKKTVKSLSRIQLLGTPWTVARQAPPSMGFSRPEYWSGSPFPPPGDLATQGLNPGLPHCRRTLTGWATSVAACGRPPNAKAQDLRSVPFPLTSTTLKATFIPEPRPASSKFLTSTPGPLSPPSPELGPSQRAASQPALL